MDNDFYNQLIVTQPQQLLTQLEPLIHHSATDLEKEVQLQARYFIASAYYYLSQRNKIFSVAEKGLTLARAQGEQKFEARFLAILAIGALSKQNFNFANNYANQALLLAEELAAETLFHGEILLLAAQVYYETGALQRALKVMVKANEIFTNLNDTKNRSEALASIALMYDELGQPEQAIEYHLQSLDLIDIETNLIEASITYYNIALTYHSSNEPQKARHYAELSLHYAQKAKDEVGAAYAIYELASLDEEQQAFDRAFELVNTVIPVVQENDVTGMIILSHLLRARLLAHLQLPDWEADLAIAEPLVEKTASLKRRIALVRTKAKIYELINNPPSALEYYKQWVSLNEEQLKATQEQSTRRYQAMFELNEAEAENELLHTQKKLAETELEAKEFRQWLLIILSLLLLIVLVAAVAMLLMQVKTKKKFREMAMVDELTNTRNRRSISLFAQQTMAEAKEKHTNVCFAMVDIDHFKSFNDRFGHDVGDRVLKAVASAIASELRVRDALGRWGGEEWLIVLPDSRCESIENIFQRIQSRLKTMHLGLEDAPVITVSMGCTNLLAHDMSLDQVVKRADEALYKAKNNGRNRFEINPG
ncbi:tetratricopeptide repeat-containing diguanylate cyclase [Alteromonas aquimaris]|uniref:tetratricopeptide repeat-containing diguanylate cyclase n=1 Tax=Alteromonas aquimaris TaxID=2998417 RepID=UPI00224467B4|nr:tetratricopeptide repeat-containing diguanylate cyclase [Alteromonas aquimaris]